MQVLKPEYERADERGKLVQLITRPFRQLNLLKINKGEAFGGHYHKKKEEFFYVIEGEILVKIENQTKDKVYNFAKGDCFLVEVWDKHSIFACEDTVIVETLGQPYSEEDTYE